MLGKTMIIIAIVVLTVTLAIAAQQTPQTITTSGQVIVNPETDAPVIIQGKSGPRGPQGPAGAAGPPGKDAPQSTFILAIIGVGLGCLGVGIGLGVALHSHAQIQPVVITLTPQPPQQH